MGGRGRSLLNLRLFSRSYVFIGRLSTFNGVAVELGMNVRGNGSWVGRMCVWDIEMELCHTPCILCYEV